MTRAMRRTWCGVSVILLALAVGLTASAGWIHAKAALAQLLLERAWVLSDHGRSARTPWPSADFRPIARISFPQHGASHVVLDRDSGQALAFGPGWSPRSAPPGSAGLSVISAHRDTQFAILAKLRAGDVVRIDGAQGRREYQVASARIVDSRTARPGTASSADALLLVTCYPFDAIVPGGPLRYVVEARPVEHNGN